MGTAERLLRDETLKRFDAEGKLTGGQGALGTYIARAQAFIIRGFRIEDVSFAEKSSSVWMRAGFLCSRYPRSEAGLCVVEIVRSIEN